MSFRKCSKGSSGCRPACRCLQGQTVVLDQASAALRQSGQVALISGGGAGHEPAHAGYVGAGMLSAAVSGDVFTSPSVDAILAAIRAVAGPGGVLLLVKSYTGDRLNFGLAAELARSEGIAAEMVVIGDDVSLPSGPDAGRRGIAGTVFVHKVAGAAAAAGLSLADVKAEALAAATEVGSMGVGLSACTVPAAGRPGFELGDTEIELGLGIHGEAGVARTPLQTADRLVDLMLEKIVADRKIRPGERVALLVNNLGGTPTMEMYIVARRALAFLAESNIAVERAWCGSFLTALEMAGCSLSLMRLDDVRLSAPRCPDPRGRLALIRFGQGFRADRRRCTGFAGLAQACVSAADSRGRSGAPRGFCCLRGLERSAGSSHRSRSGRRRWRYRHQPGARCCGDRERIRRLRHQQCRGHPARNFRHGAPRRRRNVRSALCSVPPARCRRPGNAGDAPMFPPGPVPSRRDAKGFPNWAAPPRATAPCWMP